MNLTTLSHPRAVCLHARFIDRDDAIRQLAQRLAELGKITDTDAYLAEVFHRESLGPTALGEGWRCHMAKRLRLKRPLLPLLP